MVGTRWYAVIQAFRAGGVGVVLAVGYRGAL
jgi:hypothetical protein